jgi:hypothetical protein
MKTKLLVSAILLAACLTSWASSCGSITAHKISQIRRRDDRGGPRPSVRTAITRFVDLSRAVALDWFRSVPMSTEGICRSLGGTWVVTISKRSVFGHPWPGRASDAV